LIDKNLIYFKDCTRSCNNWYFFSFE